jgi:hypothetical protein
MSKSAVTADIHQSLDVKLHLGSKLTFDDVLIFDHSADTTGLLLGPGFWLDVPVDSDAIQYLLGSRSTDAIDAAYAWDSSC